MPAARPRCTKNKKAPEISRFLIEPLSEILVCGENFEPLENRDKNRADNDERERLSEIILDEADPAFVSLTRHGEKCDRAGLRREDGKTDRCPTNAFIAFEIMFQTFATARAPQSIQAVSPESSR